MKIGIVTIYSIINYGSALQAYALQRYIDSLPGCEAELVNYSYPNDYHKVKIGIVKKLRGFCRITLDYICRHKKERERRFKVFGEAYHRKGSVCYKGVSDIEEHPPLYDIYVTGSDQVWNVHTLKNDPVMYCVFAPEGTKKIAFGASMVVSKLPERYVDSIRHRLSSYSFIGMREHSGVELVRSLKLPSHIRIEDTCDPTLLLSAKQYEEVLAGSDLRIEEKYILVYYLDYAFNPHPALEQAVEAVQKCLNLPVVFIGSHKIKYKGSYRYFSHIGPSEFAALVNGASYVVTSSFHGLMFSIVFRRPFTAIVPSTEENDTRIIDILRLLGLENRAVVGNHSLDVPLATSNPYTAQVEENIKCYINRSKCFLHEALGIKYAQENE